MVHISKKIPCVRYTTVPSGYQVWDLCAIDLNYARSRVATLACAWCVPRHGCHTTLPLDTSSNITLHPMLLDSVVNTIPPPHALLIHSAFRVPLEYYPLSLPSHLSYVEKVYT